MACVTLFLILAKLFAAHIAALGVQVNIVQSKIMYIELKSDGLQGEGRIGLVKLSKSGNTLYYKDRVFQKAKGMPLKANYFDESTLEDFWISSPRKDGNDSLFSSTVNIDEDVRIEYWERIRELPKLTQSNTYKSSGKTKAEREKIEKGLRRRQMDNAWMPS